MARAIDVVAVFAHSRPPAQPKVQVTSAIAQTILYS